MKIEQIEIKPMMLSLEPEFHITVEYSYRSGCLFPLRFNGYLFLDRHRIAFLSEYEFNFGRSENFRSVTSNSDSEKRDRRIFVAPISRLALSKLEDKRNQDPKGNLKFNLHIQFVFMESLFQGVRRTLKTREQIVLASLADNSLFRVITHDLDKEVTITRSDWLQDFSSVFQRNRYQVFEIPVPEVLQDATEFSMRLEAAIGSLSKMEHAKLLGDWETVVKESRPVWELIRNRQEIISLLQQDELNEDTVRAFGTTIDALFNFSSKFIHRESKTKGLMTINKARKEDAELIYALAASLVNLLSKKKARYE